MKVWVPLVLSLLLGLAAAVLARGVLFAPHAAPRPSGAQVAVASHDIEVGTPVTEADVQMVSFPAAGRPPQCFSSPAEISGRVSLIPLIKGQPIVEPMLAPRGTPGGLQALVPLGMRALTIEINEFSGLAGMLTPGARVDVIANIRDDKTQENAARTIVQNVKVTAVGRQLSAANASGNPAPAPSTSVTLLLTPREAQALQLATQSGRPTLTLRGYGDDAQVDSSLTSLADLRGASAATAANLADLIRRTLNQVSRLRPANEVSTIAVTSVSPATQPAVATLPSVPQRVRQTVTLIQGNDETQLSFDVKPTPEPPVMSADTQDTNPR